MKYYSAIKWKEIESVEVMWIDLEPVTQSEVNQEKLFLLLYEVHDPLMLLLHHQQHLWSVLSLLTFSVLFKEHLILIFLPIVFKMQLVT